MPVNPPSQEVPAAWRTYKRLRWAALLLTAAAPLGVPPLVQFAYHRFDSVKLAFAVAMVYTAVWLYFVVKVLGFACPRCGTVLHSKSVLLPQACPKCGLRRWATE